MPEFGKCSVQLFNFVAISCREKGIELVIGRLP